MKTMHPKNEERALRAKKAVANYSAVPGRQSHDLESDIADLLTDLQHLCDLNGDIDFETMVKNSMVHHEAEVKYPPDGEEPTAAKETA